MTTPKRASGKTGGHRGKVRRGFWLDPELLRRAQAVLGTATEGETVEQALHMVAFQAELQAGTAALAGLQLERRAERA